MKRLIALLLVVVFTPSCMETSVPADPNVLAAAIDAPDAVWIDLRSEKKFNKGHLPDAINIPLNEIDTGLEFKMALEQAVPDPTARINLYCGTGQKSTWADHQMASLGYTRVTNVGSYGKLRRMR